MWHTVLGQSCCILPSFLHDFMKILKYTWISLPIFATDPARNPWTILYERCVSHYVDIVLYIYFIIFDCKPCFLRWSPLSLFLGWPTTVVIDEKPRLRWSPSLLAIANRLRWSPPPSDAVDSRLRRWLSQALYKTIKRCVKWLKTICICDTILCVYHVAICLFRNHILSFNLN